MLVKEKTKIKKLYVFSFVVTRNIFCFFITPSLKQFKLIFWRYFYYYRYL